MKEETKSLLGYMKEYINEPNAPDYDGEYPRCWEITTDECELILEHIDNLQSQLKAKEEIISTALEILEEKQRIYSDEQRLKQLEEYNSIEGVIETLRGNY